MARAAGDAESPDAGGTVWSASVNDLPLRLLLPDLVDESSSHTARQVDPLGVIRAGHGGFETETSSLDEHNPQVGRYENEIASGLIPEDPGTGCVPSGAIQRVEELRQARP